MFKRVKRRFFELQRFVFYLTPATRITFRSRRKFFDYVQNSLGFVWKRVFDGVFQSSVKNGKRVGTIRNRFGFCFVSDQTTARFKKRKTKFRERRQCGYRASADKIEFTEKRAEILCPAGFHRKIFKTELFCGVFYEIGFLFSRIECGKKDVRTNYCKGYGREAGTRADIAYFGTAGKNTRCGKRVGKMARHKRKFVLYRGQIQRFSLFGDNVVKTRKRQRLLLRQRNVHSRDKIV